MPVVFPRQSVTVSWAGGKTFLRKDVPWDADSELVKERPELFSDEPERIAGRVERVERATRAPGEFRETPVSSTPRGRPRLPRDEDGRIIRD